MERVYHCIYYILAWYSTHSIIEHQFVFKLSTGMERVVVINSIETIKEALVFKGNDFACRPSHFMTRFESRDGKGTERFYSFVLIFTKDCTHRGWVLSFSCETRFSLYI